MRSLGKFVIGLILVVSVLANFVAFKKYRNTRPIFWVNGEGYTQKEFYGFLEGQAGPEVKAKIASRMAIEQEAKKQGIYPTDAEVKEVFDEQMELKWKFAQEMQRSPWKAEEAKNAIREGLCQQRLLVKDITTTPDELKEEYNQRPAAYDMPNKAHTEFAVVMDETLVDQIKLLMSKDNPPVNPHEIMGQFPNKVFFLGDKYTYTWIQPFGNSQIQSEIFSMKPGEVKVTNPSPQDATSGVKKILIRMNEIIPGHKSDPNDPKIKERINTQVALRRGKPWQEKFTELWGNTKFVSENANDERYINMVLFPNRTAAAGK